MLKLVGHIRLPPHSSGGFDHADVHESTGRVFVAHTANGCVEIIDGENSRHFATTQGCPEASGVLCSQSEGLVFAAARGTGDILTIDAEEALLRGKAVVGSRPNGLAWDDHRKQLLVADVGDNQARILNPESDQEVLSIIKLPGRPRWCVYDHLQDVFLVNIREPSGLAVIDAETGLQKHFFPVSVAGPHGLAIVEGTRRVLIACDAKAVVVLDTNSGKEMVAIPIAGEPDVIWMNPEKNRLYCAIGKPGVIDVIDTKNMVVDEQVKTEEGAHTLTFDPERQRLYSFLPQTCRASVFEEV
jgi:DNA-binding beta-propeller fold protein YncE